MKNDINKKVVEDMEQQTTTNNDIKKSRSIKKLLDKIEPKKEYLTKNQVLELIKIVPKISYMYDIISGLQFEITKKDSLKAIDSKNNTIYFSAKQFTNYKFYKDNFILY
jgi:hypothetical protein